MLCRRINKCRTPKEARVKSTGGTDCLLTLERTGKEVTWLWSTCYHSAITMMGHPTSRKIGGPRKLLLTLMGLMQRSSIREIKVKTTTTKCSIKTLPASKGNQVTPEDSGTSLKTAEPIMVREGSTLASTQSTAKAPRCLAKSMASVTRNKNKGTKTWPFLKIPLLSLNPANPLKTHRRNPLTCLSTMWICGTLRRFARTSSQRKKSSTSSICLS